MYKHDAIGIDPDSRNCVAVLVKRNEPKFLCKTFPLTSEGRKKLLLFIKSYPGCLLAIEGKRGQNVPLEKSFEDAGLVFYNIPAIQISHYRQAMINFNKNNENDAYAVARFILDQDTAETLERFQYHANEDQELRKLSRFYTNLSQQGTRFENRLWKLLKNNANELYLSLSEEGSKSTRKKLGTNRFLNLIITEPELSTWKHYSDNEFLEYSGGMKRQGWDDFLNRIKNGLMDIVELSINSQVMLKLTAEQILLNKKQLLEMKKRIKEAVSGNPLADYLIHYFKGLGSINVSVIMGEIGNIERFPDNNHLASYAGLTKIDDSTGIGKKQIRTRRYNAKLKNGLINFTLGYLHNNKDSHLYHYHKYLLNQGYDRTEALMRVARALLRKLYKVIRDFKVKQRLQSEETVAEDKTKNLHLSNPNLPITNLTQVSDEVKMNDSA